jgi:hypothetical protein
LTAQRTSVKRLPLCGVAAFRSDWVDLPAPGIPDTITQPDSAPLVNRAIVPPGPRAR